MSYKKVEEYNLTHDKTYTITRDSGRGDFLIGALGMNPKHFDILLDKDIKINWDCFNYRYTGSGEQNKHLYPYGNSPRWFTYHGNDTGFIAWSNKRHIEDFGWYPQNDAVADFSLSNIRRVMIKSTHQLKAIIGENTNYLHLSGSLEKFDIILPKTLSYISLTPYLTNDDSPYELPTMGNLSQITHLDMSGQVMGQPINCQSLLQFQQLEYLALSGNVCHLEALLQLPKLKTLQLRYVPNLESMPNLADFKHLDNFLGWNIEEKMGKELRKQLKHNPTKFDKEKHSNVSNLRKKSWFLTEYAMPFDAWQGKNYRFAVKSYKESVKQLKKAKTIAEIEQIITQFVQGFNTLDKIETTERESIFEAVLQLIQVPILTDTTEPIDIELALEWFDNHRDY